MTTSAPLRIAFMGTPDFAVSALEALHKEGHTIIAVYCQPPKPAGRGQHFQKTPVHITAEKLGLKIHTPQTLRDPLEQKKFEDLKLDVAVVAAYGLILPQAILSAPQKGCINIHASLLPRWRGAAPIQRAILAGDRESGITIMQMDKGLDTGAMLMKGVVPITEQTTTQSLHDALSKMGADLIVKTLVALNANQLRPETQPEEGVTYASKLTREEGKIDWNKSAEEIERQLRAFYPWPGCFFTLNGEIIKLLQARIEPNLAGQIGTILDDQFTVACGKQALRLLSVQRPGKNPTEGASLLRGLRLPAGSSL